MAAYCSRCDFGVQRQLHRSPRQPGRDCSRCDFGITLHGRLYAFPLPLGFLGTPLAVVRCKEPSRRPAASSPKVFIP